MATRIGLKWYMTNSCSCGWKYRRTHRLKNLYFMPTCTPRILVVVRGPHNLEGEVIDGINMGYIEIKHILDTKKYGS